MVITAARADRPTFGCHADDAGTRFGAAFFEAMTKADGLPAAFDRARQYIADREREDHVTPASEPQVFIGDAMAEKLKELEHGRAARRSGRMVMHEAPRSAGSRYWARIAERRSPSF